MKRFQKLTFRSIAIGLIAAGALFAVGQIAWAGLGDDEDKGNVLRERTSPLGGSIDLMNCDDGSIAQWKRSKLTFKIVDTTGANAGTLQSVRSGVLEWNNVGSPYTLVETTDSRADVTIMLVDYLGKPTTLGTAWRECDSAKTGITTAIIRMIPAGLPPVGVRNLTAHEVGHALGLRHSDRTGDLMSPTFDKFLEGTLLICPSNLDVGALSATSDPYMINPLLWSMPPFC